ncbi:uncharacterized protein BHQ10_010130 [Talaromyces amestolkiae]|uniref:CENP-V/GFA domain-containing protein n=1 Tax=Talaromyces amestolkiae TaxID=1196081 RepID=A0A364LE78_TALAM|nr:uncharacterized protein BHQ10_010130 [Talaromyces amestolkiae]RAO74118.1 hypothetical protein BHQ10_010130 [Talaromyces amestolkiae]
MTIEAFTPLKGHCTCKTITYEVLAPFLCTNCCHCTWCQRETGAAYALNAIIESSSFRITSDTKPIISDLPTSSGNGQKNARCPKCYVVIACDYGDDFTWTTFVKVGTLDDESRKKVRPDVHIHTSSKMDWVDLSSEKERGIPVLEAGYKAVQVWRKDALERFELLKQKMKASEEEKKESSISTAGT